MPPKPSNDYSHLSNDALFASLQKTTDDLVVMQRVYDACVKLQSQCILAEDVLDAWHERQWINEELGRRTLEGRNDD